VPAWSATTMEIVFGFSAPILVLVPLPGSGLAPEGGVAGLRVGEDISVSWVVCGDDVCGSESKF